VTDYCPPENKNTEITTTGGYKIRPYELVNLALSGVYGFQCVGEDYCPPENKNTEITTTGGYKITLRYVDIRLVNSLGDGYIHPLILF
jgi:hypothetical protein